MIYYILKKLQIQQNFKHRFSPIYKQQLQQLNSDWKDSDFENQWRLLSLFHSQ